MIRHDPSLRNQGEDGAEPVPQMWIAGSFPRKSCKTQIRWVELWVEKMLSAAGVSPLKAGRGARLVSLNLTLANPMKEEYASVRV